MPSYSLLKANLLRKVGALEFTPRSAPFVFLIVCFLAYGLHVSGLGFYWDDWPWAWTSHVFGARGMLGIDPVHRPLSGIILWVGALLGGKSPLAWQVLNLAFRWLTAAAAWWALQKIWPKQAARATWIGLLLLVYPGFTQQFVAINSSRHVLPMAFFLFSLGFMAIGIRQAERYWLYTGISLCLGLAGMLASEYYYGLELARPVVIWIILDGSGQSPRERFKRTIKSWLPFAGLLTGIFAWRYSVSQAVNYPVTLTRDLYSRPVQTVVESAKISLHDFYVATAEVWSQVIQFPARAAYGLRIVFLFWVVVLCSVTALFIYLFKLQAGPPQEKFWKQAIVLGLFSSLVAGLPFLATGISVDLNFPADRTILPFIFGASLLIVGLIDGLLRVKALKILVVCLLVGLATGFHNLTAVAYVRDWDSQQAFFRQLTKRAPGLAPGTALSYIYNISLQNFRSTDNSLTAPLNWIYAPHLVPDKLPYIIYDLRLRAGHSLPIMQPGQAIRDSYGGFTFGSTDNLLVIHYAPPACLRVLHPRYDKDNPLLPEELRAILPLSNLETINAAPESPATLPPEVFGQAPEADWCQYFEQADLARQSGDWAAVVRIGETALQLKGAPKNETELVPFIQGYAQVGQWQRAGDLTFQALQGDPRLGPMLCSIWADLAASAPASAHKAEVLDEVQGQLECSIR
jgi:hypothetical protein